MLAPALWDRIRESVEAQHGRKGRQIALRVVAAVQACGRRLVELGSWAQLLARLGVRCSDKAAMQALALLAEVGQGAVVRLARAKCVVWRLVGLDADLLTPQQQLELAFSAGPNGKGESEKPAQAPVSASHPRAPRVATLVLERLRRLWGARPLAPAARLLADQLERLGAAERERPCWTVTLTAHDGEDVTAVAQAFAAELAAPGSGAVLVPERSPSGRLHFHGFALGDERAVMGALRSSGAGQHAIDPVRGVARLRHWSTYATDDEAEDLDRVTAGDLVEQPLVEPEPIEATDDPTPPEGRGVPRGITGDAPTPSDDHDHGDEHLGPRRADAGDVGGADGAPAHPPQAEDPQEVGPAPGAADGRGGALAPPAPRGARAAIRRAIAAAWGLTRRAWERWRRRGT